MRLTEHDTNWLVKLLPKELAYHLKESSEKYIIAGGFLRAGIAKEKIADIDVFASSKESAKNLIKLLQPNKQKQFVTDNAVSITLNGKAVQVIHKWNFDSAEAIIEHFDFTIAQACLWYDKNSNEWRTLCADDFYQDLAAKRLIYTNPQNPEAGGSLLRMLKFKKRGYDPTIYSIAKIVANLSGVNEDNIFTKLKEIDPAAQPDFTTVNKYSHSSVISEESHKLVNKEVNNLEKQLIEY